MLSRLQILFAYALIQQENFLKLVSNIHDLREITSIELWIYYAKNYLTFMSNILYGSHCYDNAGATDGQYII